MFRNLRIFINKVIPSVSKNVYLNNILKYFQDVKIKRNYQREFNKTKLNKNRNHVLSLSIISLIILIFILLTNWLNKETTK